jgi:predicted transcriptional regulator
MATLTIRLDDEARDALEELARTNGVNLSALLREQVDVLLGRLSPVWWCTTATA